MSKWQVCTLIVSIHFLWYSEFGFLTLSPGSLIITGAWSSYSGTVIDIGCINRHLKMTVVLSYWIRISVTNLIPKYATNIRRKYFFYIYSKESTVIHLCQYLIVHQCCKLKVEQCHLSLHSLPSFGCEGLFERRSSAHSFPAFQSSYPVAPGNIFVKLLKRKVKIIQHFFTKKAKI
jgi:hypothetical protein